MEIWRSTVWQTGRWIRTSQPSYNKAWSSKKHAILHFSDERLCIFCLLIPDAFCRVLPSVGAVLAGIYHSVFQKELIIKDSQFHHIHITKTCLWCGGSFQLPHDLFHSILLYSIHFSSPITICFKSEMFSLRLNGESRAEVRSRRSHPTPATWNPNIKVINIIKLMQMIFNAWFGYFEFVGYLPHVIMLIFLN